MPKSDSDVEVIAGSSSSPGSASERRGSEATAPVSAEEAPKPRVIYEYIVRCCVRLEALNRTCCAAIRLMHRLYERKIVKYICNYSLATACIMVAAKSEEDSGIRIRDVVNVSHRILHPEKPPIEVDDSFWTLRRSLGRLEFVVLRELSFDTYMTHPHQLLTLYLDLLASWMPEEFEKFDIREQAFAILRDCHIVPEFVLEHSHESLALVALSLVLKGHDLYVPNCRDFYTVFSKHMSERKLRHLEEEVLQDVYGQRLK
ncbi:unnamed protein product, partial [Mesorhabditis spiculigera]